MTTSLYKEQQTAVNFLTDSLTPYAAKIKAKTAAYEAKQSGSRCMD